MLDWLEADPSNLKCPNCQNIVALGSFYGWKKTATCESCDVEHNVIIDSPGYSVIVPIALCALPGLFTAWPLVVKSGIFALGAIAIFYLLGKTNKSARLEQRDSSPSKPDGGSS